MLNFNTKTYWTFCSTEIIFSSSFCSENVIQNFSSGHLITQVSWQNSHVVSITSQVIPKESVSKSYQNTDYKCNNHQFYRKNSVIFRCNSRWKRTCHTKNYSSHCRLHRKILFRIEKLFMNIFSLKNVNVFMHCWIVACFTVSCHNQQFNHKTELNSIIENSIRWFFLWRTIK